jgi:thioredoxin reductase
LRIGHVQNGLRAQLTQQGLNSGNDMGRPGFVLDTRRNIAVDVLFAHPRNKPSASLHEALGLATVDTPVGIALKVDERRQTSMPGIYAAGDLATPLLPSVTVASSQGAMAGIFAQQSMLV